MKSKRYPIDQHEANLRMAITCVKQHYGDALATSMGFSDEELQDTTDTANGVIMSIKLAIESYRARRNMYEGLRYMEPKVAMFKYERTEGYDKP